jgi:mRNA interferase MazF
MMKYCPARGDLIWIDFTPQAGLEQAGRRPALVLSPQAYNVKVGLVLLCPITSKEKGFPFEVKIPDGLKVGGVILSDQVKSLAWKVRCAEFAGKVPNATVREALEKILTLFEY